MEYSTIRHYSSIHKFHVYGMLQPIQYQRLTCQHHHHIHLCFIWLRDRANALEWTVQQDKLHWLPGDSLNLNSIGISTTLHDFYPYSKDKTYLSFLGLHPVKWTPLTVNREATRRTL